jgi:hypothetical protein
MPCVLLGVLGSILLSLKRATPLRKGKHEESGLRCRAAKYAAIYYDKQLLDVKPDWVHLAK